MPVPFTNFPVKATLHPAPFIVSIPQATLDELQTLLNHSKLAPNTYEGSHDDRKYGVTNKWICEAKNVWEKEFDWQVPALSAENALLMLQDLQAKA
jgi:hypothetical protein